MKLKNFNIKNSIKIIKLKIINFYKSFFIILKNLWAFLCRTAYTFWYDKEFLVSREVIKERLAICKGQNGNKKCEFYNPNGHFLFWRKSRCLSCKCYVKAKVIFAYEKCPIGKWTEIITND